MRVFGTTGQPFVLTVLEVHPGTSASSTIGSEFVSDQNPRNPSLFADQLAQKPHRGTGIATALHQNVQHRAFAIHRAP